MQKLHISTYVRFAPQAAVHNKKQLFVGFTTEFPDGNPFLDLRLLRGLRMVKSATMTSRRSFRVAISPIIGLLPGLWPPLETAALPIILSAGRAASDLAPVA